MDDTTNTSGLIRRHRPLLPRPPRPENPICAVARALKQGGYDPIQLWRGKDGLFKGWRHAPNEPEDIARWTGCGVSLRTSGAIFIVDIDTRTEALRDAIVQRLTELWPEFMAQCPRRHSGSTTLGLFGRTKITKLPFWDHGKTHRYRHDEKLAHAVEIFTGRAKRHFVVFGPHSPGRKYEFIGTPLWEVPLKRLPVFDEDDIGLLRDACEEVMRTAGLERMPMSTRVGGGPPKQLFDLEPAMEIVREDHLRFTLRELDRCYSGKRVMCFPTPWDPTSDTPRVLVGRGATGLTLWDSKENTVHRWVRHRPPENIGEMIARLRRQS